MHLPWTQVANEVIDQAAVQLAATLEWNTDDPELAEDRALAGLVRFFRWARERCPNDRPPSASAVLPGASAARLIARQFRWTGDPEALVSALADVAPSPIVSRTDDGVLVHGLDRYDSAWRKNYRDAAEAWDARVKSAAERIPVGLPPESERKPGGTRSVSDRQTQTQTQTQKEEAPPTRARANVGTTRTCAPPSLDDLAGAEDERHATAAEVLRVVGEATGARPVAAGRPVVADLPARMDELHRQARGRPLEWGEHRLRMARERELNDLAARYSDAELLGRLRNALTYPSGKFPYFAEVSDLVRHWARYAEPAPAADLGRRARAGPDPNAGIVSSYGGVEPTPEEIAEENRRQEEWVNGAG